MDFARFKVLTFDCYGTLVDWESGLLGAIKPILQKYGKSLPDEQLLEIYGELESEEEAGEYRPYRHILEKIVRRLGRRLDFSPSAQEAASLPESIREWPPFPDTVEALRRLKTRYKLVILSNIDDDLFAHTAQRLEVRFDQVITAQQCRSYKPSLNNFRTAIERIGLGSEAILHCAESRRHDIAPARQLGIANVWVNRHATRPGPSASGKGTAVPDLEVPDLKTLADLAVPKA
ncbi:MAG: haloacid dehalogenase type II [Acidobacteriia bacterium]|nr:haloacid dehalogenase type II [Terriglobia bacterium]